jgi:hypothetical protein
MTLFLFQQGVTVELSSNQMVLFGVISTRSRVRRSMAGRTRYRRSYASSAYPSYSIRVSRMLHSVDMLKLQARNVEASLVEYEA